MLNILGNIVELSIEYPWEAKGMSWDAHGNIGGFLRIYTTLSTMWLEKRPISSELWLYITVKTLNNILGILWLMFPSMVGLMGIVHGDSMNFPQPIYIYIGIQLDITNNLTGLY